MSVNKDEWFSREIGEANPYIRPTAGFEAMVVSIVADVKAGVEFGVFSPSDALAKIDEARRRFPEATAIVSSQSSWLSDFESRLDSMCG